MSKQYSVVAMNYLGTEALVAALKPGTPVTLVREPKNAFDPNAVAVWVGGCKVGFIPKSTNKVLAAFIDQSGIDLLMNGEPIEVARAMIGMDSALEQTKCINAIFVRSPNSGYPQVSV